MIVFDWLNLVTSPDGSISSFADSSVELKNDRGSDDENMASKHAFSKTFMLLGQCVPHVKQNAAKIKVPRLVLDEYLHMYFREFEYYFAFDPQKKCKVGDHVLIRELPERVTTLITHEVMRIVYPLGDVTDPITGKKVVRGHYRDIQEEETITYSGGLPTRFKYDEAPPRGWQEGKRDFTFKDHPIRHYDEKATVVPTK